MEARHVFVPMTIAFLVAAALMLVLRPLAMALDLIDRPGGRKVHHGDVPVIGGIAMFAGLMVAAAFEATLGRHGLAMLIAAGFMVLVGALDDRFNLPPVTRLFAHLVAAIAMVMGTGFTVADLGDLFGFGTIGLGFLAPVFTVVACVALINAFNMLDGLDGLAGGSALLGFMGLAVLAIGAGAPVSTTLSCSLVGAIAGFLIFNIPAQFNRPVRAFMGDAGSTLLGFVLAAVGLTLVQPDRADIPPVMLLWIVPIPICELFVTTFRRAIRGVSPMSADANHFHHELLRAGLSVRAIFVVYFGVSGISVAIGVLAYRAEVAEPLLFLLFIAGLATWLLFVRNAALVVPLLPASMRRAADAPVG